MVIDGRVVVYRNNLDVFLYMVGSADENELMLSSVLNAFYDTLGTMFNNQVDKRSILERYDSTLLALDELIDHGYCIHFHLFFYLH